MTGGARIKAAIIGGGLSFLVQRSATSLERKIRDPGRAHDQTPPPASATPVDGCPPEASAESNLRWGDHRCPSRRQDHARGLTVDAPLSKIQVSSAGYSQGEPLAPDPPICKTDARSPLEIRSAFSNF
jgi:hypothetical protein